MLRDGNGVPGERVLKLFGSYSHFQPQRREVHIGMNDRNGLKPENMEKKWHNKWICATIKGWRQMPHGSRQRPYTPQMRLCHWQFQKSKAQSNPRKQDRALMQKKRTSEIPNPNLLQMCYFGNHEGSREGRRLESSGCLRQKQPKIKTLGKMCASGEVEKCKLCASWSGRKTSWWMFILASGMHIT